MATKTIGPKEQRLRELREQAAKEAERQRQAFGSRLKIKAVSKAVRVQAKGSSRRGK